MTLYLALGAFGALVTFAVSMTGRGPDLYWNEWHHHYLGLIAASVGLLVGWMPLTVAGLVIAWDDAVQHALQNHAGWERKRLSLLAWAWYGTVGSTVHRWAGKWLDKRLE